jgi:hypothetical protein
MGDMVADEQRYINLMIKKREKVTSWQQNLKSSGAGSVISIGD